MKKQTSGGREGRVSTSSLVHNPAFRGRRIGGCSTMPLGNYRDFIRAAYPEVRTPEVALKDLTGLGGAISDFTERYGLLNRPQIKNNRGVVRQVYNALISAYNQYELSEMFILISDVASRFSYLTPFTPKKPLRKK